MSGKPITKEVCFDLVRMELLMEEDVGRMAQYLQNIATTSIQFIIDKGLMDEFMERGK